MNFPHLFLWSGIRIHMASWVWSVVVVLCMALQVSSTNYTVVIQTDCSWFSGTEARIFLTMTGKEGRTVSAFLPNRNHFGRCATDAFIIYSNIDLKEICQITLGHGMSYFNYHWWYFEFWHKALTSFAAIMQIILVSCQDGISSQFSF